GSEISDLRQRKQSIEVRWQEEKEEIQRIRQLKETLEQTRIDIEQAERETDLARAAELKYGKLPQLQRELEELSRKKTDNRELLKEEIGEEDIAEVISRWTGIPVTRLVQSEVDKLLRMEDYLQRRVVGQ